MKYLNLKILQFSLVGVFLLFGLVGVVQAIENEETFEARVIKVIDQRKIFDEVGKPIIQQDLQLRALTGSIVGQEFTANGIGVVEVVSGQEYQVGDRVVAVKSYSNDSQEVFYVIDIVRRGHIYLLATIFIFLVILVGRGKGLRSLLALVATMVIIMSVIAPLIINGFSPLPVALVGGIMIMAAAIYLTEGFKLISHLALISISISLIMTAGLAWLATTIMSLSGFAQEEATYLATLTQGAEINFQGLLLAGIIIGALGVLDDVIVSQLEAVQQLKLANKNWGRRRIFRSAFSIGTTHLGAVVNTLFLAYVGASLPLILLFSVHQSGSMDWSQIINSELIATEIVRTLVGGIGLILAIPIATMLGVYWLSGNIADEHSH